MSEPAVPGKTARVRKCGAVFDPDLWSGPHCDLPWSSNHLLHSSGSLLWSRATDASPRFSFSTYKPRGEYPVDLFPPDEWFVEKFVNTDDCVGVVAPGVCDGCTRCSLFADWRTKRRVAPFDSALDIPRLGPWDIDPDLLSKNICGLCGGFVD